MARGRVVITGKSHMLAVLAVVLPLSFGLWVSFLPSYWLVHEHLALQRLFFLSNWSRRSSELISAI